MTVTTELYETYLEQNDCRLLVSITALASATELTEDVELLADDEVVAATLLDEEEVVATLLDEEEVAITLLEVDVMLELVEVATLDELELGVVEADVEVAPPKPTPTFTAILPEVVATPTVTTGATVAALVATTEAVVTALEDVLVDDALEVELELEATVVLTVLDVVATPPRPKDTLRAMELLEIGTTLLMTLETTDMILEVVEIAAVVEVVPASVEDEVIGTELLALVVLAAAVLPPRPRLTLSETAFVDSTLVTPDKMLLSALETSGITLEVTRPRSADVDEVARTLDVRLPNKSLATLVTAGRAVEVRIPASTDVDVGRSIDESMLETSDVTSLTTLDTSDITELVTAPASTEVDRSEGMMLVIASFALLIRLVISDKAEDTDEATAGSTEVVSESAMDDTRLERSSVALLTMLETTGATVLVSSPASTDVEIAKSELKADVIAPSISVLEAPPRASERTDDTSETMEDMSELVGSPRSVASEIEMSAVVLAPPSLRTISVVLMRTDTVGREIDGVVNASMSDVSDAKSVVAVKMSDTSEVISDTKDVSRSPPLLVRRSEANEVRSDTAESVTSVPTLGAAVTMLEARSVKSETIDVTRPLASVGVARIDEAMSVISDTAEETSLEIRSVGTAEAIPVAKVKSDEILSVREAMSVDRAEPRSDIREVISAVVATSSTDDRTEVA